MFKNFFIIVLGLILFSACSQANDVVGEKGQVDTELAERDIVEKDVIGQKIIIIRVPSWDTKTLYQYTKDNRYYIRKGSNVFALKPDEISKLGKGEYVV